MFYLIITTVIWSLSFSLIGNTLSPDINSWSLAFSRSAIACILFLPWINFKIPISYILKITFIGVLQIGVMYMLYLSAFRHTSVEKILLFTVTTPFYVTMISQILNKEIRLFAYLTILLSILGGIVIRMTDFDDRDFIGLILIQLANVCFASGQVLYKRIKADSKISTNVYTDFSFFFIGASLITFIGLIISPSGYTYPKSINQWLLVFWLGGAASGVGYYFWNYGATKVKVETLATMNNLVIPLGLLIEILLFSGSHDFKTFIIGTVIIISSIAASLRYGKI